MLSTFLDKASGLFDRRFLLAWWFPTLVASVIALLLEVTPYGVAVAWQWWQKQDTPTQSGLALGALVLVTLIAYLLQAFNRPIVRLYEGYWPHRLRRWARSVVEKRWQLWRKERATAAKDNPSQYAALQDQLHHEYPSRAERLLPTRLGNVLRSAEDYPATSYGMDAVFWWPRLWPLLPEAVQKGIEAALTPLFALLNLASLIGLVAVGGSIHLWQCQAVGWLVPLAVLVIGLVLARLSYLGAVAQARGYGQQIRAAVDLYRFDLLKALHQPLPASPRDERSLWDQLARWLYNQDRGVVRELAYQHGKTDK